jgi:hypothetical protein
MTVQETITPDTSIITIEDISAENAPAIYGHNSLNRFVEQVRAAVIGEVPDLSTDKGRKRIASLAASVARSKTAVDDVGRAYLKKLKEMTKPIEAELREFEADMNALRDEVRKPLNEWQAQKDAEEDKRQSAIDQVVARFTLAADANADEIQSALFGLEQEPLTEDVFGARLEEAESKRTYGITLLTAQLAKRQQYEQEQAELVENRRKIAALEEEKRIKAAADKAVEDERLQREAAERKEDEARAANRAHQGKINKAALDAILAINMAGDGQQESFLSEVEAKAIVAAIIRGQIPAVSIAY